MSMHVSAASRSIGVLAACLALLAAGDVALAGESTLEGRLQAEGAKALAQAARTSADAARGALLVNQAALACTRCHAFDGSKNALGPDLTNVAKATTDEYLAESILWPSRVIRSGFECVTVVTTDGKTISGLVVESTPQRLLLRDPTPAGPTFTIPRSQIESQTSAAQSLMPSGLVNQLADRQQFLDIVRYLAEIRDGGAARARELQPSPELLAAQLPGYEQHVDHAGMIADLDQKALVRGERIYKQLCVNCHGTVEEPGSLPTSLRFASGKFKSGSDPYGMYQTLTHGFGLMMPQAWMVPQQKYDVIHYICAAYLKPHNSSQYVAITPEYLAGLPRGDTRGPAPRVIEPWVTMDYGPVLASTYQVGGAGNIAPKGIAVRLDAGPGGVSRGRAWFLFEHDTFRMAGAWTGTGFIDWNAIHFNGAHQSHPSVVGDIVLGNPAGPGWADPETGSFEDNVRILGRDGRRYGPLPKPWAQYRGLYVHDDRAVLSYTVGRAEVLETPGLLATERLERADSAPIFTRAFHIGSRPQEMRLLVATSSQQSPPFTRLANAACLGAARDEAAAAPVARFDGANYVEAPATNFDSLNEDFTIGARLKTKAGGTIVSMTRSDGDWIANGKSFFVADGHLLFDIGWVGQLKSNARVDDGQWHDVAVRWDHASGLTELFIDGKSSGKATLRPTGPVDDEVLRVGFTAPNFPERQSYLVGELQNVRYFNRRVSNDEIADLAQPKAGLIAHWKLDRVGSQGEVPDAGGKNPGKWKSAVAHRKQNGPVLAGLNRPLAAAEFYAQGQQLCLRIAPGPDPVDFTLWMTRGSGTDKEISGIAAAAAALPTPDWRALTSGGRPLWPQVLTTDAAISQSHAPFAVDVLTHPENNPWLAQTRFTGLDFYPDGDRMVVSSWDGDVWLASGIAKLDAAASDSARPRLEWRRIAAGLFQPLGIKIVKGDVYVTCRDQLVVLRDLNGDGETDFYECFNNDHQVTEHFHEFAMGLQVDDAGNFYYAKSARHALPAVVPHHGTLLRISADGSQTDILATGFRAANGVCLNPDGSFFVTDQEGHWTPKNRINWVTSGGFYGNLLGYHDVTDERDAAMLLPLCWITNSFDRSPAELLWTPRNAWGPLAGTLLNLSYGNGQIFVVPLEDLDGQKQGGMCALPLAPLPTGVMRGRFHPADHQLYTCGMFAWAGNRTQPGGVYRIRYTGAPMHMPVGLRARKDRLEITFTDPLDKRAATNPRSYAVKTWGLKRSADYGSPHVDEKPLDVEAAQVSADGLSITLKIPRLQPTWGMEIICRLKAVDGTPLERTIHNSIYKLAP